MNKLLSLSIFIISILCTRTCNHSGGFVVECYQDYPQVKFATDQVRKALSGLENMDSLEVDLRIVFEMDSINLSEQEFQIKKQLNNVFYVYGGDANGLLYGGLEIADYLKLSRNLNIPEKKGSPYVKKRGIKFNIPLDQRAPSHDDSGTSAQTNVIHMWDIGFWKEYIDLLALHRYNVLSLWNQHPFSSMIKLTDYPDVALEDVYNSEGKVKNMSMEEKIRHWQNVMEYAENRGIEMYIITWNIHLHGAVGKYGITEAEDNEIAKDYLRKSVEQLFKTYPRLRGIGITAGENMNDMNSDDKEQWLWETYGLGIMDYQKNHPERNINFIHRFWWTDYEKINKRFGKLRDGFDMSFKYARARMYSSPSPKFAENELLPLLPEGVSTWWNIRNDDIYNLRWGDPDYTRSFILNLPKENLTAGYYMGSDRYAWGRESISKNPEHPRMLENHKHWYNFLMWGKLGYDPQTPNSYFKDYLKYTYPGVSSEKLFNAYLNSSKIIPLVNKFHWYSWDYLWWPEACISTGYGVAIDGYHDIHSFIETPVMKGTDLMTIVEYSQAFFKHEELKGRIPPNEVAEQLLLFSGKALELVGDMNANNNELSEVIKDIKAMAELGNYYAYKIRGAMYYKLYLDSKEVEYKDKAIKQLKFSLESWKRYSAILDSQYNKMNIAMHGHFDWDELELEVANDIEIVRSK